VAGSTTSARVPSSSSLPIVRPYSGLSDCPITAPPVCPVEIGGNTVLRHYRNFSSFAPADLIHSPCRTSASPFPIFFYTIFGTPIQEKGGYTLAMRGGGVKFYDFSVGQMGP
jgi:hypothetical protein